MHPIRMRRKLGHTVGRDRTSRRIGIRALLESLRRSRTRQTSPLRPNSCDLDSNAIESRACGDVKGFAVGVPPRHVRGNFRKRDRPQKLGLRRKNQDSRGSGRVDVAYGVAFIPSGTPSPGILVASKNLRPLASVPSAMTSYTIQNLSGRELQTYSFFSSGENARPLG